MQITYCIDSTNKYKYLEGNRLLSGNIYNPLWAALQWLTMLWCWNLAHCVNAPSNTVTHLFCWQSPVILFTAIRPQNHTLAEYISLCFHNVHTHIVFARLQKQFSSATEHQPPHLIYSSILPFGFLLPRGPLKIGLHHLSDHCRGGLGDGCVYVLSRSPPGIWDRERERTWRARWGPWTRVCNSSSNWLRRECCSGGRNRYTVLRWRS